MKKREGRDATKYRSLSYAPFKKNGLTVMCYIIFCLQMSDFFSLCVGVMSPHVLNNCLADLSRELINPLPSD